MTPDLKTADGQRRHFVTLDRLGGKRTLATGYSQTGPEAAPWDAEYFLVLSEAELQKLMAEAIEHAGVEQPMEFLYKTLKRLVTPEMQRKAWAILTSETPVRGEPVEDDAQEQPCGHREAVVEITKLSQERVDELRKLIDGAGRSE